MTVQQLTAEQLFRLPRGHRIHVHTPAGWYLSGTLEAVTRDSADQYTVTLRTHHHQSAILPAGYYTFHGEPPTRTHMTTPLKAAAITVLAATGLICLTLGLITALGIIR